MKITRRKLITGGIVLGGGAAVVHFGKTPFRRFAANFAAQLPLPSGIFEFRPQFWFEFGGEGGEQIVLRIPKAEMGQDIFTGFALLVAEELDVSPDRLAVLPGALPSGAADLAGTGGSSTTASLYVALRGTAAVLRETLKLAASKKWNVSVDAIETVEGELLSGDRRASYGEIAEQMGDDWDLADEPELRPESSFKYVGKPHPRVDLRAKVLAEPIYALDAELPGMVWASVLYSPYIDGKLKRLDASEAEAFPGVERVVQEDDLVAVIAETRFAAESGKRLLKAEWDVPHRWTQQEIDDLVRVDYGGPAVNLQHDGRPAKDPSVQAQYRTPLGAHAHMEPNGMIVQVEGEGAGGKAVVITGSQMPVRVRQDVARALDFDEDQVEVRNCFLGGGFGRRYFKNNAAEAARLARLTGKPVSVFKNREEEFRNGYLRPNAHHILRGDMASDGRLLAFEHVFASGDMMLDQPPLKFIKPILGADWISAGHGFRVHYDAPYRRVDMQQRALPFMTGIWRSVGMLTNLFATESFFDELAAAAGVDPLEARLRNLESKDPIVRRLHAALEAAAEHSGWSERTPGSGWGAACAEDRNTVAATVVKIRLRDVDGPVSPIQVEKVVQVIDPGKIIHPDGVRAQVEGATMMALSAALYEEVRIEDGRILPSNFHQYPVATLRDAPEIEVVLLEGMDAPSGVGEPPMAPVAPAIANALFDLTGQRLRDLPLRPTGVEEFVSGRRTGLANPA